VVANDWEDGWLCSSGSMLSTENDPMESEDGVCLILELGSGSSAVKVDAKESWSENVMPPLL
jgi:hypothetical protein